MPEGPETKRMADILFKNLVGFEIINSQLLHPDLKKIKNDSNLIIKDVFSRGKAIIIRLENGQSIITHNQLYGKWTSHHLTTKINHNRVLRIKFCTKKKAIRLWSATNIKVLNTSNEIEHPYLSKIGPDILDKKTSPETILNRLTTIGALYLTFVCLLPEFLISKYPIPFYLGGTSILIVVVVAMDTVTQVQTRLMSSQYESLIKKTKFGK